MRRSGLALLAACLLVGCKPFSVEAPTPEPSMPASPAVFAVRFGPDLLVPLGCVADLSSPFESGKACTALLSKGAHLTVSDLGEVSVRGPAQAQCEADGHGTSAVGILPLDAQPLSWPEAPAFAWWPMDRQGAPSTPSSFEPDTTQLEALNALAGSKAKNAPGDLLLRQAVAIDLNGDGQLEHLYSLTWGEELGGAWAWSALLREKQGSGELEIIYESQHELFEIIAHLDLNQDGKRELWTRIVRGERETDQLETWDGDKVTVIGRWSCL